MKLRSGRSITIGAGARLYNPVEYNPRKSDFESIISVPHISILRPSRSVKENVKGTAGAGESRMERSQVLIRALVPVAAAVGSIAASAAAAQAFLDPAGAPTARAMNDSTMVVRSRLTLGNSSSADGVPTKNIEGDAHRDRASRE
ncbi:hypothetical protein ACEWB4_03350 [Sphingobium sp. sgz301303]|uniref:hypothetical protein n=1 Tax=Sphingobium sp. sgz301304 TaxID=3341828 RepID=UPI0035A61395